MSRPPRKAVYIPTAAGPAASAVRVYTALARSAPPPTNRQRHPQLTLPLPEVAARAGCSTATVKRATRMLERAGWLQRGRLVQPGRRGGRLRGRARYLLVMPPDAVALPPARSVGSPFRRVP